MFWIICFTVADAHWLSPSKTSSGDSPMPPTLQFWLLGTLPSQKQQPFLALSPFGKMTEAHSTTIAAAPISAEVSWQK